MGEPPPVFPVGVEELRAPPAVAPGCRRPPVPSWPSRSLPFLCKQPCPTQFASARAQCAGRAAPALSWGRDCTPWHKAALVAVPGPAGLCEAPSDVAGAPSPAGERSLEVRDPTRSLEPKRGATATPEGWSPGAAGALGPRADPRVSLRPGQPGAFLQRCSPPASPQETANPRGEPRPKPSRPWDLPI